MLEVLYATVLEPDLIGQVVEVPPERVRLIEKNGDSRPLGRAGGAIAGGNQRPARSIRRPNQRRPPGRHP